MTKKIVFLFVAISFTIAGFAQIYEPIKWNHELKITGATTADVIIRATIDEGWHLYGLNIPKDGPRPTSIVFETLDNAEKVGKIQAPSKLLEAYDPNFEMKLNWYAKEAVFIQKIKFSDSQRVSIKGYVEFMACNDESCLPPTQEDFQLGVTPVAQELATEVTDTVDTTLPAKVSDYWTPVVDE
jgi:thiol:disulfide interchange protein DsbD